MTRVFIGVPSYGQLVANALRGLLDPSLRHDYAVATESVSLLGTTFNRLWCGCLNDGSFTHFAMHHADIEAPAGWLDVLLEEMGEDAGVISAVVPVKDYRGLTSTGSRFADGTTRRVALRELPNLPPTFDSTGDGGDLVINTGLMVVRLTETMRTFPGFNIKSGVRRDGGGKLIPVAEPEDWGFSMWCHANGVRVRASQTLRVVHHGVMAFDMTPWPEAWSHDIDPNA